MLSIFESFTSRMQSIRDHILQNKYHYMLGTGLAAGLGGAYYLANPKFHNIHADIPKGVGLLSSKNLPTGVHMDADVAASQIPSPASGLTDMLG